MKNETQTEIGLGENLTSTLRNFTDSMNGSLQHTTPFIMEVTQPKTSKYQRILLGLLERKSNITNETELLRNQSRSSDVPTDKSQKVVALTVPLVLLGVFLVLVVICHRIDTIRSKRRNEKRQIKASKGLKGSEREQAVEEVGQDVNKMLLIERHKEMMRNRVKESIGKLNHGLCQDDGEDKGRCMCRLKRCAHCLGYEAKRIQWQGKQKRHVNELREGRDGRGGLGRAEEGWGGQRRAGEGRGGLGRAEEGWGGQRRAGEGEGGLNHRLVLHHRLKFCNSIASCILCS